MAQPDRRKLGGFFLAPEPGIPGIWIPGCGNASVATRFKNFVWQAAPERSSVQLRGRTAAQSTATGAHEMYCCCMDCCPSCRTDLGVSVPLAVYRCKKDVRHDFRLTSLPLYQAAFLQKFPPRMRHLFDIVSAGKRMEEGFL